MQVAVLGVGKMGSAFAKGLLRSGTVAAEDLFLIEQDEGRRRALRQEFDGSNIEAELPEGREGFSPDVALLSVKPQDLAGLLGAVSERLDLRSVVLSIVAGVKIASLESRLGKPYRIVRAMPNLGATVGAGVSAFAASKHARQEDRALARTVLEAVGPAIEVPESKLDAVTAVSGSGPAYVFLLAEAMERAAVELGLSRQEAETLVAHTVLASGLLLVEEGPLKEGGRSAAEWREAVTSKGGTTEAALRVFQEHGFSEVVSKAIEKAARRAAELDALA